MFESPGGQTSQTLGPLEGLPSRELRAPELVKLHTQAGPEIRLSKEKKTARKHFIVWLNFKLMASYAI